jgi:cyclophilin family peptidyl-prolyl cis-trans isomerase
MKRFALLAVVAAGCGLGPGEPAAAKNPVVVMKTSMGTIKVELFEDKAPITVKNFLGYVDDKFYDGTIFHRVIGKPHAEKDFMIQGGGFKKGLKEPRDIRAKEKKTKKPIKNEARKSGLSNKAYTLAMARTGDPDSATAQFFINVADNKFLDPDPDDPDSAGYAVFGRVIEGKDVVDKIKAVKTRTLIERVFENVPVEEVVIESVRRADK